MGRWPGSPYFPSRLPLAPAFQIRKVAPPTEGPGFTAKEKRQVSGRKKKSPSPQREPAIEALGDMGSPTGTIHCAGRDQRGNSGDFRCVTKDSHWSVGSWQLSPPGALISLLVGGAVPGCIRAVLGITQLRGWNKSLLCSTPRMPSCISCGLMAVSELVRLAEVLSCCLH